jgi:DNA-binding NtrC family response regulator
MAWISLTPQKIRKQILLLSPQTETPIWLSGPRGAGKSKIAQWMHENSPRSHESFLTITPEHVSALKNPEASLQYLMDHPQSTYFIENFEHHNEETRSLLTQLLRKKSFKNSQGQFQIFRGRLIISAETPPQEGSELAGYFRNSQFQILPLHARMDEFDSIIEVLWTELTEELHLKHLKGLSEDALHRLKSYHWPGNLRELRNVLIHSMKATQTRTVNLQDIPDLDPENAYFLDTKEKFLKK